MANAALITHSGRRRSSRRRHGERMDQLPEGDARSQTAPEGLSGLPRYMGGAGASVIQRKCSCGGSCPKCSGPGLGAPGDAFEKQADDAADSVMAGKAVPNLSQVSSRDVQRKGDGVSGAGTAATGNAAEAVGSGGRPLDRGERSFFEPRFGRDLSGVRIHTDGRAGEAARGIGASAYTLGGDIAFAPGAYRPGTQEGRHLLAHELAHTMQQGNDRVIRRTCPSDPSAIPAGGSSEFEAMVDTIRALDTYTGLAQDDKDVADHIIDGARGSACPMYYITMLHTLFTTVETPDEEQAEEASAEIEAAAEAEEERLELEEQELGAEQAEENRLTEENLADNAVFTPQVGDGGTIYYVDARDPNNVIVRLKVRLTATGAGTADNVADTVALEDAIEKEAATRGYTVDVVFVNNSGPDVFEADVNTDDWPTSGNWVTTDGPATMAHEANHLLGLEDRYNYIESHAGNEDMEIGSRLYWFREQMVREGDPTSAQSMMADHSNYEFDDLDVCSIATGNERTTGPFQQCVRQRMNGWNMYELEQRGRALMQNYEPQNASVLRYMAEAWTSQCFRMFPDQALSPEEETNQVCYPDPEESSSEPNSSVCEDTSAQPQFSPAYDCHFPPQDAFGDAATIYRDGQAHPLRNPHIQPSGEADLQRTPRTP